MSEQNRGDKFVAGAFGPLRDVQRVPCYRCVHAREIEPVTCAAFPDGIPEEILEGENDHTAPVPGDHGVRFTPKP